MVPFKEMEREILNRFEALAASPGIYQIWFGSLRIEDVRDGKIVFSTPQDFQKEVLERSYSEKLSRVVKEVCGDPFGFEIVVRGDDSEIKVVPSEKKENKNDEEPFNALLLTPVYDSDAHPKENMAKEIESPAIIRDYTFENFIVGDSNKFAHAACAAVASRSDDTYNPLFIYGPSGLGKTHLLYAITNRMKENNPNIRIVYKKGDDFTNELIDAIQKGTTVRFRENYRSADVLLIDDIQFIAGKESTQEEFFHTFSALYEAGKQIILTSDRPPKEIKTLEERLRTRFEWGLIADIQPPSFELRTAIIRKKAEKLGMHLPKEVVDYMAERLTNNIRQIEGAIKKLSAIVMLTGNKIEQEAVENVVKEFSTGEVTPEETVKKILMEVSRRYNVSIEDIKGTKRSESIVRARHLTVYLIRKMTDFSFSAIGKLLGRDHTTVMASNANVEEELKKNSDLEAEIHSITEAVKK